MRRIVTAVGILAVTASLVAAQSATTHPSKPQGQTKGQAAETPKSTKAMAKPTATGTVDKFENNVLTVTTKKGPENFTVGSETVIQEGGKKVDSSALKAGEKVTVRYSEASGTMTASRITISKASPTGTSGKMDKPEKKKK